MNAVATVPHQGTSSLTLLPDALQRHLQRISAQRLRVHELPVLTPDERKLIPAAIAAVEATLQPATTEDFLKAMGLMSAALPMRKTPEDAERMFAVYEATLNDVPGDVLHEAAIEAIKTLKFFPKVAELRELAMPKVNARRARRTLLEQLARKHDEEWRDPVEMVKPDDLQRLSHRLAAAYPSQRKHA